MHFTNGSNSLKVEFRVNFMLIDLLCVDTMLV